MYKAVEKYTKGRPCPTRISDSCTGPCQMSLKKSMRNPLLEISDTKAWMPEAVWSSWMWPMYETAKEKLKNITVSITSRAAVVAIQHSHSIGGNCPNADDSFQQFRAQPS